MPTEAEKKVLELLSAMEVPPDAGERLEERGNAYVTVVCEAALGSYAAVPLKKQVMAQQVRPGFCDSVKRSGLRSRRSIRNQNAHIPSWRLSHKVPVRAGTAG